MSKGEGEGEGESVKSLTGGGGLAVFTGNLCRILSECALYVTPQYVSYRRRPAGYSSVLILY